MTALRSAGWVFMLSNNWSVVSLKVVLNALLKPLSFMNAWESSFIFPAAFLPGSFARAAKAVLYSGRLGSRLFNISKREPHPDNCCLSPVNMGDVVELAFPVFPLLASNDTKNEKRFAMD